MNNTSQDKVQGLLVIIKTDKGLFEVSLSDDVKHRIWKIIDNQKILLVGNDLSELLTIKK